MMNQIRFQSSIKVTYLITIISLFISLSLFNCGGGGGDGGGTTTSDTTAPTVSSTSPASNDTGFAVNSAITATFSETMDASTVTTATFTVGGVTGTVTYTGTTATFTPSSSLSYSTAYTATITTGVKDAAGNNVASPYTWTFTTGSASAAILTWDAPTTNADGTPLTDLSGYKIYYGTSSENYTTTIDVGCAPCSSSCPGTGQTIVCTYIVQNIAPGTYYFAVTAYDTEGNESEYSNEVSKAI